MFRIKRLFIYRMSNTYLRFKPHNLVYVTYVFSVRWCDNEKISWTPLILSCWASGYELNCLLFCSTVAFIMFSSVCFRLSAQFPCLGPSLSSSEWTSTPSIEDVLMTKLLIRYRLCHLHLVIWCQNFYSHFPLLAMAPAISC